MYLYITSWTCPFNNIQPARNNIKIKLQTYYKSRKVHALFIKNKHTQINDKIKHTNIILKYSCSNEDCLLSKTDYHHHPFWAAHNAPPWRRTPRPHNTEHHRHNATRLDGQHDYFDDVQQQTTTLYIRKEKPKLNKQLSSCVTLSLFS